MYSRAGDNLESKLIEGGSAQGETGLRVRSLTTELQEGQDRHQEVNVRKRHSLPQPTLKDNQCRSD